MGQTGYDTDHNDQRNAVTDTAIGDLLAQPHNEHGTSDQNQSCKCYELEGVTVYERFGYLSIEIGNIGGTLQHQHSDRQETSPLVELTAAALTLLLHLLEVGNDHTHQLDDNRCGDVGHNTKCEYRSIAECTTGEDVQQTQQAVALHLVSNTRTGAQRVGVDTGDHHEATKTVDQQKAQGIDDTLAQILDLPDVLDSLDKLLVKHQTGCYQCDDTKKYE